ncbi:hypothetical protein BN988_03159 [Oceanobacillus picturae]|uniref:Uncharacterized protein n=1 Tax=Oceanobacillus picturae TaxID=171693 RepID=W9APR6_9BACI|nr:hypothetical protein BN988_03159 [Oceanobacillus picturae]
MVNTVTDEKANIKTAIQKAETNQINLSQKSRTHRGDHPVNGMAAFSIF